MADIEGSKPRKFITKTKLTNPSLYSVAVTSLLDPENNSLPKIYQALQHKQKTTAYREAQLYQMSPQNMSKYQQAIESKIPRQYSNIQPPTYRREVDSLNLAEKQFQNNKSKKIGAEVVPTQRKDIMRRQTSQAESMLSRGSSLPSLMSFNYKNSWEIMHKQKSQYNIISNM